MQPRNLGTISGKGVLRWKNAEPVNVQYTITGLYRPARHTIEANGTITNADGNLFPASGRSDVVMTTDDGRNLEIVILDAGRGDTATIAVNSQIEEFSRNAPRQG
jgi:hypothetical protein